jgi:DNA-directed RNA polymerase subunit beta'
VIIRTEDCGTEEHLEQPLFKGTGEPNEMLVGRFAAREISTKRNRTLVEARQEIGLEQFAALVEAFAGEENVTIPVRSVLKCEAPTGVCQQCYGRSMAPASRRRSATRSASWPPSRSASPARS